MEITKKILKELQNRLKVGNRRGVHLNAVPGDPDINLTSKG